MTAALKVETITAVSKKRGRPRKGSESAKLLERFDLENLQDCDLVSPAQGTRGRLLSEAVKLFATMGYDACSVRDLAHAIGTGAPTIYNHYGSKREILVAAVDHILSDFFHGVLVDHPSVEPRSLLFSIIYRHAIYTASRQPMAKAFDALVNPEFMKRAMEPEERARFSRAISQYITIIQELIDAISGPDPQIDSLTRARAVHELADRAGWWFQPEAGTAAEDVAEQTCIMAARLIGTYYKQ